MILPYLLDAKTSKQASVCVTSQSTMAQASGVFQKNIFLTL